MLKKVFAGLAALVILVSVNPINNTKANNDGQSSTVATEISGIESNIIINAKDGAIILTFEGASDSKINTLRLHLTSSKKMTFSFPQNHNFNIYKDELDKTGTDLSIYVSKKDSLFTMKADKTYEKSVTIGYIPNPITNNVKIDAVEYVYGDNVVTWDSKNKKYNNTTFQNVEWRIDGTEPADSTTTTTTTTTSTRDFGLTTTTTTSDVTIKPIVADNADTDTDGETNTDTTIITNTATISNGKSSKPPRPDNFGNDPNTTTTTETTTTTTTEAPETTTTTTTTEIPETTTTTNTESPETPVVPETPETTTTTTYRRRTRTTTTTTTKPVTTETTTSEITTSEVATDTIKTTAESSVSEPVTET
ncbi:MAG: hypothetical protein K2K16_01940, partial [Ruminococcus sp.]|nr:hypothetical protein [Ruminococcus sp.]